MKKPIFIVGCGRSGTTILGHLLRSHPHLAYLNEARHIWLHEPRTDIWTAAAREHNGRLSLTADDVVDQTAAKIERDFALAVRQQEAHRLVEKLPINSFRVDFIDRIFPEALFIHLIRNGIAVAQSISQLSGKHDWYGHEDYKWHLLREYATRSGLQEEADLCEDDHFLRGLMEWRLSVTSAQASLYKLHPDRYVEIRYEELLRGPLDVCTRLEDFIGVETCDTMHQFALKSIDSQLSPKPVKPVTPTIRQIAGPVLLQLGYVDTLE